MPAWTESASRAGLYLGAKIVNVFPGNAARGLPAVAGLYVLQSGRTGETLAAIDGTRLTLWRTAAASALAARHLARPDAKRLLDRRRRRARAVPRPRARQRAALDRDRGLEPPPRGRAPPRRAPSPRRPQRQREPRTSKAAVAKADVISCATLATAPLIAGRWLKAGQHLDLVGAFSMGMREADDEALRRARVFVDTEAALHRRRRRGDRAQERRRSAGPKSSPTCPPFAAAPRGGGRRTRSPSSSRSARRSRISPRRSWSGARPEARSREAAA